MQYWLTAVRFLIWTDTRLRLYECPGRWSHLPRGNGAPAQRAHGCQEDEQRGRAYRHPPGCGAQRRIFEAQQDIALALRHEHNDACQWPILAHYRNLLDRAAILAIQQPRGPARIPETVEGNGAARLIRVEKDLLVRGAHVLRVDGQRLVL